MKNKILIKNIDIYNHDETLKTKDILINGGLIEKIGNNISTKKDIEVIDGTGLYSIPGFIDLQVNGAYGSDIWDASEASVRNLIKMLPSEGTTRFLYTYITADVKITLSTMKKNAILFDKIQKQVRGAFLEGFHLEGPFIDKNKKGTHNEKYIIPYNKDVFETFWDASNRSIRVVTFSPTDETISFTKEAIKRNIAPSIGHSAANNSEVKSNIDAGAIYCTHLFNGMTGIDHHEVFVAHEFLINPKTSVMLIADFIHLTKSTLELVLKTKSTSQIMLVTDSVSPKGLKNGVYNMGPIRIQKEDSRIHLLGHPETLAGSGGKMSQSYKNILSFNYVTINDAVAMSSFNQAKLLKINDVTGSIREGMIADIILMNKHHDLEKTICRGSLCFVKNV